MSALRQWCSSALVCWSVSTLCSGSKDLVFILIPPPTHPHTRHPVYIITNWLSRVRTAFWDSLSLACLVSTYHYGGFLINGMLNLVGKWCAQKERSPATPKQSLNFSAFEIVSLLSLLNLLPLSLPTLYYSHKDKNESFSKTPWPHYTQRTRLSRQTHCSGKYFIPGSMMINTSFIVVFMTHADHQSPAQSVWVITQLCAASFTQTTESCLL